MERGHGTGNWDRAGPNWPRHRGTYSLPCTRTSLTRSLPVLPRDHQPNTWWHILMFGVLCMWFIYLIKEISPRLLVSINVPTNASFTFLTASIFMSKISDTIKLKPPSLLPGPPWWISHCPLIIQSENYSVSVSNSTIYHHPLNSSLFSIAIHLFPMPLCSNSHDLLPKYYNYLLSLP